MSCGRPVQAAHPSAHDPNRAENSIRNVLGWLLGVGRKPMRRRDFVTLLGCSAAAWPLAAHAQQADRVHRIGVLMNKVVDDREGVVEVAAFEQGLQEFGWTDGRNVRIDYRWAVGDADLYRRYAAELVALAPDVILAVGG